MSNTQLDLTDELPEVGTFWQTRNPHGRHEVMVLQTAQRRQAWVTVTYVNNEVDPPSELP